MTPRRGARTLRLPRGDRPLAGAPSPPGPRAEARRAAIVDTAMRYFAEHGFAGTRVDDVAAEIGISKGLVFQYFESKEALFLATFKKAVLALPAWLDAPPAVLQRGFFATVRYWLERTLALEQLDWIRFRVAVMGTFGIGLDLKRDITRFMASRDPYGTYAFVRRGVERGEVRADLPIDLVASMLDWLTERIQEILLSDPADADAPRGEREQVLRDPARLDQVMALLEAALGAPAPARTDTRKGTAA